MDILNNLSELSWRARSSRFGQSVVNAVKRSAAHNGLLYRYVILEWNLAQRFTLYALRRQMIREFRAGNRSGLRVLAETRRWVRRQHILI